MDIFLWILIAAGLVIYLTFSGKGRSRKSRYQDTPSTERNRVETDKTTDPISNKNFAESQLNSVNNSMFRRRPLMNKGEYAIFCKLEKLLSQLPGRYRLFAQVSLGEILHTDNDQAYKSINCKRSDFVIIDRAGYPVAVIEYQGGGHYQKDASIRDAIKREACNSAGIVFTELHERYSDDDLRAVISILNAKAD